MMRVKLFISGQHWIAQLISTNVNDSEPRVQALLRPLLLPLLYLVQRGLDARPRELILVAEEGFDPLPVHGPPLQFVIISDIRLQEYPAHVLEPEVTWENIVAFFEAANEPL